MTVKHSTWNSASTVDEYAPPFNGDHFVAAQVTSDNYFVWYPAKQFRELHLHLQRHKSKALILEFSATVITEDCDNSNAYWACFDYVNGHKGSRRYVHIFNTRKEAQALRRAHPDIVLPPIRVWVTH